MSRGRHLYAMGERIFRSEIQKRKAADVFERDPFKIQSYNFHYADRPVYPVQNFQRQTTPSTTTCEKVFESLYYNPDFERKTNDKENTYNSNNNSNSNNNNYGCNSTTKFQEFRRRKFLQDYRYIKPTSRTVPTPAMDSPRRPGSATVTAQLQRNNANRQAGVGGTALTGGVTGPLGGKVANASLLRSCCNREYLNPARGSSTSCLARQASSGILLPLKMSSNQKLPTGNGQARSVSQVNLAQRCSRIQSTNGSVTLFKGRPGLLQVSQTDVAGSKLALPLPLKVPSNRNLNVNRGVKPTPSFNSSSGARLPPCASVKPGTMATTAATVPGARSAAGRAASGSANRPESAAHTKKLFNAKLEPKKSTCSGCEININITPMDESNDSESVRIKIATDSCLINAGSTRSSRSSVSCMLNAKEKSSESIVIDKRLSKYSLRNRTVQARHEELRESLRSDIARERERFAERERERESLRQRERELDRERLRVLERERELDRMREIEREHENQREREREQDRRRRQQEIAALAAANAPPPKLMKSHLYRKSSTERVPSIVPFCLERSPDGRADAQAKPMLSLRSPRPRSTINTLLGGRPQPTATTSKPEAANQMELYRAKRLQAHVDNGIDGLRGLKRRASVLDQKVSRTSQTSNNEAVYSSQMRYPVGSTQERKLLNVTNPLHTRLNNVPIRITTSTRRVSGAAGIGGAAGGADRGNMDDVTFKSVRVHNDDINSRRSVRQLSFGGGGATGKGNTGPYNVNINVYADNLKMMRI